jgi:hypothetical protein
MSYLERCYEKSPDIVSRKIADEVILVPIRKRVADVNAIYLLQDEVSRRIWELIDGKRVLIAIRKVICKEFEVDEKTAAQDILKLANQLEEAGCIIEINPSG